ncbi:cytochrome c [Salinarimonas soli]|uniref:C-type cytochrome n=1 Tax=Salinarimonas soli TaxID=1638099 RepID=A0A5B2V6E2_9HYPH|nr:cytochrome c [Salinarimonas soli]KAA2234388.1 c-type cytochrome [Salinarimonas soli]
MKRFLVALLVLAALGAGGFWLLTSPGLQKAGLGPAPAGAANVENGRVAFYAGGCASCHATPNQDDRLRLGGGYALHSPFGTFYAPNLSPHPRDGIGGWTEAAFIRAMKAGVSPDGRHYYPAFPYTSYQRMTDTDARDLFAFIKTLAPVEGRAPDHDLPFPFNVRRGLGLWKLAFLDGETFRPDPAKSASLNRGAYLTQGLGHCAECHSGRTVFGNIAEDRRYAGGPNPEGKGWVPNITPHGTGLKEWTRGDIVEVLTSGLTPTGDSVGSTMTSVVKNTAELPEPDRAGIAEFLLSLPPKEGRKGPQ